MESRATFRYYDSLVECDPEAFAQTSKEICERLAIEDSQVNNQISEAYRNIEIPKIYAIGSRAVMSDAKKFLTHNNLKLREFNVPSHWIMDDAREEFYSFLKEFIAA